jgi:hypothetical protein
MAKLSGEIQGLLAELNQKKVKIIQVAPSYVFLRPGNVISFRYFLDGLSDYKMCLVVKNDLGKIGYTTKKGNRLLSCFRLADAPPFVISFILKTLYNKPKLAQRQLVQDGIIALLGTLNYRTYKLNKIRYLYKIYLEVKKLPEDDEDELSEYSEEYLSLKDEEDD